MESDGVEGLHTLGFWEVSYQKIEENFDLAPTLAADRSYH